MTQPAQESTYFIRQRYEDAAQVIFQQQQKRKKDLPRRKHRHDDQNGQLEFAHYGNQVVIATKEGFDRASSASGAKNKVGKSPKRKDSTSSKGKDAKEQDSFVDKYTLLHPLYNITPVHTPQHHGDGSEVVDSLKDDSYSSEDALSQSPGQKSPLHTEEEQQESWREASINREASIDRKEDKYIVERAEISDDTAHSHSGTDKHSTENRTTPNLNATQNIKPPNLEETERASPDLQQTKKHLPSFENSAGVVDFGHYGNTGIVANKQAVMRMASILRTDRVPVKSSKVCVVM